MITNREDLKSLIAQDRLEEVVKILLQKTSNYLSVNKEDVPVDKLYDTLLINSGHLNQLIEERNRGTLNREDERVAKAEIERAILYIIDELPDMVIVQSEQVNKKVENTVGFKHHIKRHYLKYLIGLFVIIGIMVVFMLIPKDNLPLGQKNGPIVFNVAKDSLFLVFMTNSGINDEFIIDGTETVSYLKDALIGHYDLSNGIQKEINYSYVYYLVANHKRIINESVSLFDAGVKNHDEINIEYDKMMTAALNPSHKRILVTFRGLKFNSPEFREKTYGMGTIESEYGNEVVVHFNVSPYDTSNRYSFEISNGGKMYEIVKETKKDTFEVFIKRK